MDRTRTYIFRTRRSLYPFLERPRKSFSTAAGEEDVTYNFKDTEGKWQRRWDDVERKGSVTSSASSSSENVKYVLSQFPYPSGALHMGHVRVYTISDALARFHRMKGDTVLHPMGWDAFGLPAENAAMQRNVSAARWTEANIEQMREQLRSLGFSFDWSRELRTCAPEYYRWTQWIFLQMHRNGLAMREESVVWWDPVDKTTLANEQVDAQGVSWRSGAKAERIAMPQWKLRITEFAESLLAGLDQLPRWPEEVKQMQRNWIGPSDGVRVRFALDGTESGDHLEVFTTRVDTLLGVTYLAVASEHPLSMSMLSSDERADIAANASGGKQLSVTAVHPLTGERLPVYAAAYVLPDYGEGAVMAVPAHDARDAEFAERNALPSRRVIDPQTEQIENSGEFDGLSVRSAAIKIAERLEREGSGERRRSYRLRDWCVSRQRRWGAPIPMVHCSEGGCGPVPVPESELPVHLPSLDDVEDEASKREVMERWAQTTCPSCGGPAHRDTDTLDTFVDSSWYFLRFLSSDPASFDNTPWPVDEAHRFMPVSEYIGGVEHAVLHLLYARFVTHFLHTLRDADSQRRLVPCPEPFESLLTQGMVLGRTVKCRETGGYISDEADAARALASGTAEEKWEKMSKSKHNGVDPLELVEAHGADITRLSVLFAAPPDMSLEWDSDRSATGCARWIERLWKSLPSETELRDDHGAIATEVLGSVYGIVRPAVETTHRAFADSRSFNVAIATLMKLSNEIREQSPAARLLAVRPLLMLLAPMAPHICAELWERVACLNATLPDTLRAELEAPDVTTWAGNLDVTDVHAQRWPCVESNARMENLADLASAAERTTSVVAVQIGGKMRGTIEVAADGDAPLSREVVEEAVLASKIGSRHLDEERREAIKRVVFVNKKDGSALINFVL